jgi:DNA-binding NarL/FixJ family response regulator
VSIKILLAEDHKIVREGTRQLLEQSPSLEIVGEAADGLEVIRKAGELSPDVIVMDVRMPELSGLEATRIIKTRHPGVRILILSAYDDDRYIFPLLTAGASGYLLKTSSGAELAEAIHTVHNGGTALSPRVAGKVVERLTNHQPTTDRSHLEILTEREMEVLRAVAWGMTNKNIATSLSISSQTVQVHLRNIFNKLGVSNRSEAAVYAIRQGWVTLKNEDD